MVLEVSWQEVTASMGCIVSIVMPAYNAEKYIENTIASILSQTFEDWELIVVDDKSTDKTADLVDEVSKTESRVRLIRLENNFGGPAGPRNVGVQYASSGLIAFCDSDDLWHPEKLEKQMRIFDGRKNFFSATKIVDFSDDSLVVYKDSIGLDLKNVTFSAQSLKSRIPTSSVLVSKSLLLEHPFNESPEYKAVEDFHCWLRILKSGVVCNKILEPLVFYRICEGQISGSKISMLKKVYMVHKNFDGRGSIQALFFTITHVIGSVFTRFFKGTM